MRTAKATARKLSFDIRRVRCDTDHALDDGNDILLTLLDLSAAFDTIIDHGILCDRLERMCGATGLMK